MRQTQNVLDPMQDESSLSSLSSEASSKGEDASRLEQAEEVRREEVQEEAGRKEEVSVSKIDDKIRSHKVVPDEELPGFVVTSGTTGVVHKVRLVVGDPIGHARCDCTWAIKRPHGKPCSHVLAVIEHARSQMPEIDSAADAEEEEEF